MEVSRQEPEATTVVVVAYGVDSVDLEWVPTEAPVVVVHNDDRLPPLERPNTICLQGHGNIGFGAGINLALAHVTTPRVVIVNPDIALQPLHWRALATGNSSEIVALPLDDGDGQPTIVVSRYPGPVATLTTALQIGARFPGLRRRRRRFVADRTDPTGAVRDYWVSGACVSFPTALLRRVGGFDERFFLYFEDVDLCRRIARVAPDTIVRLADGPPARHAIGGTASTIADRRRVRAARAHSAWRYASAQQGAAWWIAARVIAVVRRSWVAPEPEGGRSREERAGVVLLSLGRQGAFGERRRVASWKALLADAGTDVHEIKLREAHPARGRPPSVATIAALSRGHLQPEALSWSIRAANRELATRSPRLVICVSGRAFHPDLLADAIVLDYVDRLSVSYLDRAGASTNTAMRLGFRALAAAARRFEERTAELDVTRVAAGIADAAGLGATFLPITAEEPRGEGPGNPDIDLAFVGKLTYPPNAAALDRLSAWWPELQQRRPGTTLLVAGASPSDHIHRLVARHGWTLLPDFAEVSDVLWRARVAVAPLPFASGIQIKVVDAAAHGVPQVVSPPAVQGLPSGAPVVVAEDDRFVTEVIALLDNPDRRRALSDASLAWVREHCSVAAWKPVVSELLTKVHHQWPTNRP